MLALRFVITVQTPVIVAVVQVWTPRAETVGSHFLGIPVAQASYICFFFLSFCLFCFVCLFVCFLVLNVAGEMVYPLVLIVKVSQDSRWESAL